MRSPRVSVVVANHNMSRFIVDAIESILSQTLPAYEITVVDDGSTDDSLHILRRYQDHPKVRVVSQENGGQAKAKNRGIQESRGDYIGFCDSDDMWAPNKLERQMPVFESDPLLGVVHTNFVRISADGSVLGTPDRTYFDGWISGRLLVDNFVNGMASVIKRSCFEKVGLFDESLPMGIDYDLWLRISPHFKFKFVDEKAYLYRQWEGQMSHRHQRRFECAVAIMKKFIEQNPGVVDDRTVREAWAHTFVGRGISLRDHEKRPLESLKYFGMALKQSPLYWPAWKSILRTAIVR